MRNIIATIAVLLSVCANAQYREMLHAHITPTNKVVTSVPDWVKGAADYYTFGFRKDYSLNGFLSFAHGTNVVASGDFSFASGKSTLASAESSHAEGNGTVASGFASHAEGCTTVARGNCSHAEGRYTTANGTYSHSSGVSSFASNNYSFVWSGVLPPTNPNDQNNKYGSNGDGTFNVNPIGGTKGFYIGGTNLATILSSNSGSEIDLEGFATEADLLAFYYPDGSITSMDQITTNGIQYAVGSDGGAYVVKGEGLSGNVVLPWKVTIDGNEYKVTAIGEGAFDSDYYSNEFNRFTAPITVKSIGDYAFYICDTLTYIYIPSKASIGSDAFNQCYRLKTVSLPSVTNINYNAFFLCESLTSVILPSAISIRGDVFNQCHSLKTVELPSATSIGNSAFFECRSLTSISLPSTTSIGSSAFESCTSLQSISLPSATSIGSGAFIYCNSLTSVSLHSVTSIGRSVFIDCTSLTLIDFGSSPKSAVPSLSGGYPFGGVPTTCRFIIPLGMYDEWIAAPNWSNLYAQGYKFDGYANVDDVKNQTPTQLSNGSEIRTADSLFRSMDNQNVLWTYVYGESVWLAVTNYMRTVAGVAPSFQLWEVRDGKTNCVYWSAEEIDIRVGDKIDIAVSNIANSVATTKADRAWAKYQSMTGADNPQPNDITIVSTPSVMLSGGYEWQRFIDTGNEIWIFKCNCPTMLGSSSISNGVNTGNGYFRIYDAEGKTHFSVERTDSKLVDAVPDSVSFSNDDNRYFQVSFQSNVKPSLYVSTDLNTPFIECKEDSENDYGLTCSWTESDGIYTATIMYNPAEGKPSKLFAYGKVVQEGSVVIKNTAATSFDGGIIIGGTKYTIGTAVIDGKTVLTLENGQAVSE